MPFSWLTIPHTCFLVIQLPKKLPTINQGKLNRGGFIWGQVIQVHFRILSCHYYYSLTFLHLNSDFSFEEIMAYDEIVIGYLNWHFLHTVLILVLVFKELEQQQFHVCWGFIKIIHMVFLWLPLVSYNIVGTFMAWPRYKNYVRV